MQMPDKTPVPAYSNVLRLGLSPIYRSFDWIFTSRYNPLYRSGTLAVGLLFVLLITGLYLSFFYSVSEPYESVVAIDQQRWLGRWIRALHRYSTVAAIVAVAFHTLQLLSQGKTWGPRTLAWVVGVLLTVLLFASAWTGYVMVWDRHGQVVAIAGASVLGAIPFLHDTVGSAFNGITPMSAGFFFMNLFLHVALPLMMIFCLWIHTSRLSRAVWFPGKTLLVYTTGCLVLLSCCAAPPLLEKADLLRLVGRLPIDWSVTSWLLFLDRYGVGAALAVLTIPPLFLLSIPMWCRPKRGAERLPSSVDIERCTGCTQCALDCPYDAITMVPKKDGRRLVAVVNTAYCVSCGICGASCTESAVGPPNRTLRDQLITFEQALSNASQTPKKIELMVVACTNNTELSQQLACYAGKRDSVRFLTVECCGCLHSETLEMMLANTERVALIGCPARNCYNRDGLELLSDRIYEKRVPFLARDIDRQRILITAYSGAEFHQVSDALEHFTQAQPQNTPHLPCSNAQRLRIAIGSILLAALLAVIAQSPARSDLKYGLVRVSGVLPASMEANCREPSEKDSAQVPFHMRPKQICDHLPVSYQLEVNLDGRRIGAEMFEAQPGRNDRPVSVNRDFEVPPGNHRVHVRLKINPSKNQPDVIECDAEIKLSPMSIYIVRYQRDSGALVCG